MEIDAVLVGRKESRQGRPELGCHGDPPLWPLEHRPSHPRKPLSRRTPSPSQSLRPPSRTMQKAPTELLQQMSSPRRPRRGNPPGLSRTESDDGGKGQGQGGDTAYCCGGAAQESACEEESN